MIKGDQFHVTAIPTFSSGEAVSRIEDFFLLLRFLSLVVEALANTILQQYESTISNEY